MLLTRIRGVPAGVVVRLSNIPLLRCYENSMESADYKHYVPPGPVVYGGHLSRQAIVDACDRAC
jgi:hypothetical protein